MNRLHCIVNHAASCHDSISSLMGTKNVLCTVFLLLCLVTSIISNGKDLIPLQVYGEGIPTVAEFSPCDRYLLTGDQSGVAILWDLKTQKKIRSYLHGPEIDLVSFSPDGKKIATSGWSHIKIWDLETGRMVSAIQLNDDSIRLISHDLTRFATTNGFIWDIEQKKMIHKLKRRNNESIWPRALAISPDNQKVVVEYPGEESLLIVDISTGHETPLIKANNGASSYGSDMLAEFSPDGKTVLVGGGNQTVSGNVLLRLWDVNTGKLIRLFTGNDLVLFHIDYSSEGNSIVSYGYDGNYHRVKVWDVNTGNMIKSYQAGSDSSQRHHVALSNDGKMVCFHFLNQSAFPVVVFKVVHIQDDQTIWDFRDNRVNSPAAITPDGKWMVGSFGGDSGLRAIDLSRGSTLTAINTGSSKNSLSWTYQKSYALSPTKKQILIGGQQYSKGLLKLWDVEKNLEIKSFELPSAVQFVMSPFFTPDEKNILSSQWDHNSVFLWDAESGQIIKRFEQTEAVGSVVLSPDGKKVFTGGKTGIGRLWDIETGEIVQTFTGHRDMIISADFSPDGKYLVTFPGTNALYLTTQGETSPKLWNVETGEFILDYNFSESWYFGGSIDILKNGTSVVAVAKDVVVFDRDTGKTLSVFKNPNSQSFSGGKVFGDDRRILLAGDVGISQVLEFDNPRLLIVAGGGDYPGNVLNEQTKSLAEYTYSIGLGRGYENKDVRYLSAFDYEKDLDGDLQNDVQTATKASLKESITHWAKSDLLSPGRRFTVYLIDHGMPMTDRNAGVTDIYFCINPTETISASELDSWLDTLTTEEIHIDITLVVDACYSGGFVHRCTPPQGFQRLTIASTGSDSEAMIMPPPDLSSFSYIFWGAAYMGATMQEAFQTADTFFKTFRPQQRPMFDDNGDGLFTNADGLAMAQDRFGKSWAYAGQGTGEFPAFEEVIPSSDLVQNYQPGSPIPIYAEMFAGSNPLEVWANLRPPAPPVIAGEAISSNQTIQQISLHSDPQNPAVWNGQIPPLEEEGLYVISFTARYPYERVSRPTLASFTVNQETGKEEQLQLRAILIAGDGEWRTFAQEEVQYSIDVCYKRGYENNLTVLGRDNPIPASQFKEELVLACKSFDSQIPARLLIYIVGDCSPDGDFVLDAGESISATDLIGLLNQLQAENPALEIILIADCPYAGKFVEANRNSEFYSRVILAGASSNDRGFYLRGGANLSFSRELFGKAFQGYNLYESFRSARTKMSDLLGKTTPMMDENGDGISDKKDSRLAKGWYIGRRGALAGPGAASLPTLLSATADIDPEGLAVRVDILEGAEPVRVWVTVVGQENEEATPVHYPEYDLLRHPDSWSWQGTIPKDAWNGFGKYALFFNAVYQDNRLAESILLIHEEIPAATPTPTPSPTLTPTQTPTPPPTPTPEPVRIRDWPVYEP